MLLNSLLLQDVHENVHVFTMKLNYSEPKIYTGGVDISVWSKLSSQEKKEALSRPWYIYYSFRDPKTGKLVRQPNIKAGVNKLKNKRDRYVFLTTMQQALLKLLQYGFNPYEDNSTLEAELFSEKGFKVTKKVKEVVIPVKKVEVPIQESCATIAEALQLTLELKENMMNKNSFVQYKSRIGLFERFLKTKNYLEKPITFITKKLVIEYLNGILIKSSSRNRNNSRTDIASMFQLLEDNEVIELNFVRKIPILKSVPKRNKTYSPKLEKEIYSYLEKEDSHLLLFVKFISYNFLRPIEVCRLRIEDVDIQDRKIYVKAKNKPVKIKIIPEILLNDLPDLANINPKSYLFGRFEIGENWEAEETNKRNEFSKRFKVIKEHFELGEEFGMYSFRHTFITKLYRQLRKKMSQHEAKSNLLPITGHATMVALEKYLRDVDAELPEDYSSLIK